MHDRDDTKKIRIDNGHIDSSVVIFPVFKYLNMYVPKSTMGVVYPLKVPSTALMTYLEIFKFTRISVHRYRLNIISFTWRFQITVFVALSAGKVKSTLNLYLVVIFLACVCHCITASFSGFSFSTNLTITIVELHPLSNRIQKFLNLYLPFLLFIQPCIIEE